MTHVQNYRVRYDKFVNKKLEIQIHKAPFYAICYLVYHLRLLGKVCENLQRCYADNAPSIRLESRQ